MLALLPHAWFADLPTLVLLLIAVAAMGALIRGADWLVEGAAGLALRLGMPKVIVGATIVSLGTTSPEAAVSVLAAWQGNAGLALGNGVGSIIADTGLIFGLGCMLAALPADRFVLSRQGWVQVGSAVLLAALCYSVFAAHGTQTTTNAAGDTIALAQLGRWVGVLLVALLAAYLAVSVRWSRQHPMGEEAEVDEAVHDQRSSLNYALWGLIGLAVVIVGGDTAVQSVSEVTLRWGVPEVVVASTLVAFGTSLPELLVGITSIRKGHPELLVGNVIGADILNVLFVIGFSALAKPLPIIEPGSSTPAIFLWLHLPTMLLMLFYMRLCVTAAIKNGHFSRWMGAPLLTMYVLYSVVQYVVSA